MACVMATDSQIMALSTMFTTDVVSHYGGDRISEQRRIWAGRAFAVLFTVIGYAVAMSLQDIKSIFDLAIRFGFSGFAALAPIMLAALYWKRSTKWGALAATLWVAAGTGFLWWLHEHSAAIAPLPGKPPVPVFEALGNLFLRTPSGVTIHGYMPVMFLCLGTVVFMVAFSLMTRPPRREIIDKYFDS
jgi:Na+/proline symporter